MKLINGQDYEIPLLTSELREHFEDPRNYTREIMQQFDGNYYEDIVQAGDTLLDIGANVGLFSLHVSPFFKRIICVEPTPSHFSKLQQVINGISQPDPPGKFHGLLQTRIDLEQAALSNYTGETTFYWCGVNTTMNSLHNRGDRSMQVQCITLADLLTKYRLESVDFCKIDIEGSEDVAITVETLQPICEKLLKVFIELHPPSSESQDKFTAIFEAVGYKVKRYVHDSLICTRV